MTEQKRRTLMLSLVTCFYWFATYTYVPILSPYAESMGASHKMVGLIIGSYGFTQMLLRIPLGIFSDTLQKRKPFVSAGLFLGLVSALGLYFYEAPAMILLFRSVSGMAAATWVTYTVLFSSYYEGPEAPKAIGIINSFTAFGQMTAMLLGGLAAQFFGPRATFLLAAGGAVIGVTLSFGVIEQRALQRKPLRLQQLLEVGLDPRLLLVSALAILSQLLTFATVFGFTPVAAKNIGAGSFELGLLTTLSTLPGIFASALSGAYFARKYGERTVILWGFLLTASACLVIPFVPSMSLLYLSQIAGGFGRGLVFPLLMGLSIKAVEEGKRATAMGFFQAIYGLGMFIGPVLVGYLSDAASLAWGFVAVSLMGFLGAAVTGMVLKNEAYQ